MVREHLNLRPHPTTEKQKESPGRIISHDVHGDKSYYERANLFRTRLAKTITPLMPPEEIINKVVETALFSEFNSAITNYQRYENMKETIASALLRDQELKEKILQIADKYRKPEHNN